METVLLRMQGGRRGPQCDAGVSDKGRNAADDRCMATRKGRALLIRERRQPT